MRTRHTRNLLHVLGHGFLISTSKPYYNSISNTTSPVPKKRAAQQVVGLQSKLQSYQLAYYPRRREKLRPMPVLAPYRLLLMQERLPLLQEDDPIQQQEHRIQGGVWQNLADDKYEDYETVATPQVGFSKSRFYYYHVSLRCLPVYLLCLLRFSV